MHVGDDFKILQHQIAALYLNNQLQNRNIDNFLCFLGHLPVATIFNLGDFKIQLVLELIKCNLKGVMWFMRYTDSRQTNTKAFLFLF